ncbi:MAG: CBS domain-containing protein [Sphingomonadaceae bacterium]
MKVSEVMTSDVAVIGPEATIREAAQKMLSEDAGSIPVCDGERLCGMITDRDIAVRAVADGKGPDTPVSEIMTGDLVFCLPDEELTRAALTMARQQVRRLPVADSDSKRLVGIVSIGDVSRADDSGAADMALEGITDPGGRHHQEA